MGAPGELAQRCEGAGSGPELRNTIQAKSVKNDASSEGTQGIEPSGNSMSFSKRMMQALDEDSLKIRKTLKRTRKCGKTTKKYGVIAKFDPQHSQTSLIKAIREGMRLIIPRKYIKLVDLATTRSFPANKRLIVCGIVHTVEEIKCDKKNVNHIEICDFSNIHVHMFILHGKPQTQFPKELSFGHKFLFKGVEVIPPMNGGHGNLPILIAYSLEDFEFIEFIKDCSKCIGDGNKCRNFVNVRNGCYCQDHVITELRRANVNRPDVLGITSWETKNSINKRTEDLNRAELQNNSESSYKIKDDYFVFISKNGSVRLAPNSRDFTDRTLRKNRKLGIRIITESYSAGSRCLAAALDINTEEQNSSNNVKDIYTPNFIKKIGFNPRTGEKYTEPEYKKIKPQISISSLNKNLDTDVNGCIELTDDGSDEW